MTASHDTDVDDEAWPRQAVQIDLKALPRNSVFDVRCDLAPAAGAQVDEPPAAAPTEAADKPALVWPFKSYEPAFIDAAALPPVPSPVCEVDPTPPAASGHLWIRLSISEAMALLDTLAALEGAAPMNVPEDIRQRVHSVVRKATAYGVTMDEIAIATGVARGAISLALQELVGSGLVVVPPVAEFAERRFRAYSPGACWDPESRPQPASGDAPARGFRCALFSDGQLWVRSSVGTEVSLSVQDTQSLMHYLERMAVTEGQS